MTNEEDVPRFSLRRGARFLETLRDQPESEADDERWFADLGNDEPGADPDRPEGEVASLTDASGQSEAAGESEPAIEDKAADGSEPAGDQPEPEIALHRRFSVEGPSDEPGGSSYKRKLEALAAVAFEPPSPPTDEVPQPAPQAVPEPDHGEDQPVHVPAPDQEALREAVSVLEQHLVNVEEALARASAACTSARMVLRQGQAQLDHPSIPAASPTPEMEERRRSPEASVGSRLTTPLRRLGSVTLRDLLHPK